MPAAAIVVDILQLELALAALDDVVVVGLVVAVVIAVVIAIVLLLPPKNYQHS